MTRDVATLQILLERERDRVQTLVDLLAAVISAAGGAAEVKPIDVAKTRGQTVEIQEGAGLVLVRLAPK